MSTVAYPHIELSPKGVPMITGTQIKVVEVVLDRMAHHWDADEIHRQHPSLSLAQIYAALTYYYDHQDEIDKDIEDRLRREDELIARLGPSPVQAKLQAARRAR
jgi:uncharacterized protein (DUF433 family)